MTLVERIKMELSYAREEFRFWARQELRLTRDEFAQKMRAERRIQELERRLVKLTKET